MQVSKKFEKISNYVELPQNEAGEIFIDNPDQEVLQNVLPFGVSE